VSQEEASITKEPNSTGMVGPDVRGTGRERAGAGCAAQEGAGAQEQRAGTRGDKKILYLDMDGVLVDFDSGLAQVSPEVRLEYGEHQDRIPGIFGLMDPMPGALEAYVELCELFDVFILSTAPWENPSAWIDKLLWVKKYLGPPCTKRLILTHRKDLNLGDILVDDRPCRGHVADFQGEVVHFGSERFPGWDAVLAYLREAAK
jgi:5'-nucleotidase